MKITMPLGRNTSCSTHWQNRGLGFWRWKAFRGRPSLLISDTRKKGRENFPKVVPIGGAPNSSLIWVFFDRSLPVNDIRVVGDDKDPVQGLGVRVGEKTIFQEEKDF